MLTCILGRALAENRRLLCERLGRAHDGGGPCFMIVPEQYTLQAERDIIGALGLDGLLGIEVLSFSRLAHRVFSLSGGPKRPVIDAKGRAMLVRRALFELGKENAFCARSADRPGFSTELTNTISELKAYGVTPDMLRQAAGNGGHEKSERLTGILSVYEKVEQAMRGQFSDGEELLDLLAQKLPQTGLFREARVFIDGFESLSLKWTLVIRQLLVTCKGVDITFCMPAGREADAWIFESEALALDAVLAQARDIGCGIETIRPGKTLRRPAALAHLERNLFAPGARPYAGDMRGLEIARAAGKEQEADAVAARMVRLHRENHCPWRDMAVIVPDLASDGPVFRRVFRNYNIPCFIDEKRPLSGHPLVRLVVHALRAAEANYPQKDMAALMKTGLAGVTLEEAHALENYMIAHGVRGNAFRRPFQRGSEEEAAAAEPLRLKLMGPLIQLEQSVKNDRRVLAQARAVLAYLEHTGAKEALEAVHARLELAGDAAALEASAQAADTLRAVLEQAVALMGDVAAARGEFVRMLQSALRQEDTGIIPTGSDEALVGTWERTRLPALRALFVTGCADGAFPPLPDQSPLLGDPEKDALLKCGMKTGPDAGLLWAIAQLRVFKAVIAPDTLLHVSTAAEDRRGAALQDALLFKKLLAMFPEAKVCGSSLDAEEAGITNTRSAVSGLALRMGKGSPLNEKWRAAFRLLTADPNWKDRMERLAGAADRAMPPPRLPSGKTLLPRRVSVSRLETYAACPFKYFVRYALAPVERERPEWTPLHAGAFAHEAMELFARRLMRSGKDVAALADAEIEAAIGDVLRQVTERAVGSLPEGDAKPRYWAGRLGRTVRFCAWLLVEQLRASDFVLEDVELDLPEGACIEAAGARVPLIGRIDRVDVLRRGGKTVLRLVDYKSSGRRLDYHEVYHGLCLQLPLYAHALLQNGAKRGEDVEIGGMMFFALDVPVPESQARDEAGAIAEIKRALRLKGKVHADMDILTSMDRTLLPGASAAHIPARRRRDGALVKSGDALDAVDMRLLIGHAAKMAARIVSDLKEGVIAPRPVQLRNEKHCGLCEYRSVCRFDEAFPGAKPRRVATMTKEEFFARLAEEEG